MNMKRNYAIVILILLTFFVVSFLTNILGALNPNVSSSYTLTDTMAGFLPFAFFIAYGIMSIPAGLLVEKWGEKRMMVLAFVFAFIKASATIGLRKHFPQSYNCSSTKLLTVAYLISSMMVGSKSRI